MKTLATTTASGSGLDEGSSTACYPTLWTWQHTPSNHITSIGRQDNTVHPQSRALHVLSQRWGFRSFTPRVQGTWEPTAGDWWTVADGRTNENRMSSIRTVGYPGLPPGTGRCLPARDRKGARPSRHESRGRCSSEPVMLHSALGFFFTPLVVHQSSLQTDAHGWGTLLLLLLLFAARGC